jgi:hypothetical protein
MSLNAKIGAWIFAFGLVLGCFIFNPAFANEVNYNVFYSTDYMFRITSMYYNSSDSDRVMFEFKTLSESTKMEMDILPDNQNYGSQPQLLFGTPPQTVFNQNHNPSCILKNWLCTGSPEVWGGLGVAYRVLKGDSILCTPQIAGCTGGISANNVNGITKSEMDSIGFSLNNPLFLKEIYSPFFESPTYQSYYGFTDVSNPDYHALDFGFTSLPPAIDGICGLDNGAYLERTPPTPPRTLCQSGTASGVVWFPYEGWAWTCYGENGGSNDSCLAYITTSPVNAVCGIDDGQTLDNPPENFCLTGILIFPSYLDTISGYNWTCAGLNGGSPAYCSALKGNITPPIIPENEDCTILDIPDRWFCQISNAIQNAFLPSSDKLDELNGVVNQIQRKFPFNYISFASDKFSYISGQVSDGTLSITILGNSGVVNLGGAGIIATSLKTIMYFWISLMFIFWALGYIKHFFK